MIEGQNFGGFDGVLKKREKEMQLGFRLEAKGCVSSCLVSGYLDRGEIGGSLGGMRMVVIVTTPFLKNM